MDVHNSLLVLSFKEKGLLVTKVSQTFYWLLKLNTPEFLVEDQSPMKMGRLLLLGADICWTNVH